MAATHPVLGSNSSDDDGWQTLVRDQRYRLFAAGNRRAAIAECLPPHVQVANPESETPSLRSFDARYGLRNGAQKPMMLFTQVSHVSEATPGSPANALGTAARQLGRWEVIRRVQPVWELKSYIDQQAGSLVFFLTRSTQGRDARAVGGRERLVDSAVRIGKSLGLEAENLEALRVAGLVHELGKLAPQRAEGGTFFVTGDEASEGERRCGFSECERTPVARLAAGQFCAEHFIATCYERLDKCAERLGQRKNSETETEEMRAFLRACVEQATALTRNPFHQDSLERARLLDILYTAGDLLRHIRRSPRRPDSIAVRLSCETPGRPWEEQLRTKLISRHGAMLECSHLVRPEDWLFVERVDTGRRVRARMAWRGPTTGGHFPVALEFLDADNFWELSWAEHPSSSSGPAAKRASA
jgi:hypothetical protein